MSFIYVSEIAKKRIAKAGVFRWHETSCRLNSGMFRLWIDEDISLGIRTVRAEMNCTDEEAVNFLLR